MLLNCGVGEDSLESSLDCKEIEPVHPKGNQSWIFIGRTDAETETPILWPPAKSWVKKRPWFGTRLKAGGEGDDRRWDGWMTSPTQQTWVWVNSRSWWWTGRPGVLRFMGSQRVRHDWAIELNWYLINLTQNLETKFHFNTKIFLSQNTDCGVYVWFSCISSY